MRPPIADSYWVVPDRLLAGEYPGARSTDEALHRLEIFREAGITSFVDLTEETEGLAPYDSLLKAEARFARRPIRDAGCPSVDEMRATLDLIDAELQRDEVVYTHCWGGHGRTGTVVGCWLVRHGLSGQAALDRIAELRRDVPEARWRTSPETEAQAEFVRAGQASSRDRKRTRAVTIEHRFQPRRCGAGARAPRRRPALQSKAIEGSLDVRE